MRNKILNILKSTDDYASGEEISRALGISRAAVWKHIKKLKDEGYDILSATNKGYKLMSSPDIISAEAVTAGLKTEFMAKKIIYMSDTDSTNEEAKRRSDLPDGTLFIAESQSGGKGRLGRSWQSPRGTGIWMSLLLKPDIPPADISQITLIAGMAICRALGSGAKIKWPNDVVIGSRKVCGVLTEMSAEADRVNYVICGIGINVNTPCFDDELSDKATSLMIETGAAHNRAETAAAVINELEPLYNTFKQYGFAPLAEQYRSLCVTIGREIRVIYRKETLTGQAVDIDDNGGLVVDTPNGRVSVTSGDVSVRGIYGYI